MEKVLGSSSALVKLIAALMKEAGMGVRDSPWEAAGAGTHAGCPLAPWWQRGPASPADSSLWCTIAQPCMHTVHKYHHGKDLQLLMDTGLQDLEECWVALEVFHPFQGLEVAHRMPGYPF